MMILHRRSMASVVLSILATTWPVSSVRPDTPVSKLPPLLTGPQAVVDTSAGEADVLHAGVRLFRDRTYSVVELPAALQGKQFVRASLPAGLWVTCCKSGTVYVITPDPQRNPDSLANALIAQGFVHADTAPLQLFNGGSGAISVIFQKQMVAGERIKFRKWGVLVAALGRVDRTMTISYTPRRVSMITNHAVFENGKPVAMPDMIRPKVESVLLYQPTTEWTYSHHAHITFFKGQFIAIWSNGHHDEDAPGQRVLIATSKDFRHWTTPHPLVDSVTDSSGQERVLTAAGFHQYNGTLAAYFGDYGPHKESTHLCAVTTTDGEHWSPIRQMGIPVNPNHGPEATATGRLIISGNISFPYTDDPSGLSGWTMTGIYNGALTSGPSPANDEAVCGRGENCHFVFREPPHDSDKQVIEKEDLFVDRPALCNANSVRIPVPPSPVDRSLIRGRGAGGEGAVSVPRQKYPSAMVGTSDDPASFWRVAKRQQWPVALCEGSFYQTDDGVLHMLLRSTGEGFRYKLWVTESRDNGATWSEPAETNFSDDNAKFHFGRLPDGRFYYVGNPLAGNRIPLVLSLSHDGVSFDRHYLLGDTHYEMHDKGRAKGGEYGYPHSMIHDGYLYVIISRQKEGVEVLRVALSELK